MRQVHYDSNIDKLIRSFHDKQEFQLGLLIGQYGELNRILILNLLPCPIQPDSLVKYNTPTLNLSYCQWIQSFATQVNRLLCGGIMKIP